MKKNSIKSFEVYADEDFSGNWDIKTAMLDESTAKSRSGYALMLHDCPSYGTQSYRAQYA